MNKPATQANEVWLVDYESRETAITIAPHNDGFFSPGQDGLWGFEEVSKWHRRLVGNESGCPHCNSNKEPWFDRVLDHKGDMTFRCGECGGDVDSAPATAGREGGEVKQVIVMRSDLKIKHMGKFVAQGAHASIAFITNAYRQNRPISDEAKVWVDGIFKKIVLRIHGEEELRGLARMAREKGLEVHEIIDRGLTEFNNVPTLTCIAIGPNFAKDIDPLTRGLKLL